MIQFTSKGDYKNTEQFLKRMAKADFSRVLKTAGERGKAALAAATPVDSGLTAESWGYQIRRSRTSFSIIWTNTHKEKGFLVAIGLQYGHGTGGGGYVRGQDYINPAMKPIMEQIVSDIWKEVTTA